MVKEEEGKLGCIKPLRVQIELVNAAQPCPYEAALAAQGCVAILGLGACLDDFLGVRTKLHLEASESLRFQWGTE